jgi:WD repeat-containing protein 70
VLTSASATVRGPGSVVILTRGDLTPVRTLTMPAPAVRVLWHPKINQLLIGLANGQINVLYSPLISANGAKLLANKGPPRARVAEDLSGALVAPTIITPGVHEEVGNPGLLKRKREEPRGKLDPRKLRRPELPIAGPGRGGRVGASATQHIVQHLFRDTSRDEDVCAELSHRCETTSDQSVISSQERHYSNTQNGMEIPPGQKVRRVIPYSYC